MEKKKRTFNVKVLNHASGSPYFALDRQVTCEKYACDSSTHTFYNDVKKFDDTEIVLCVPTKFTIVEEVTEEFLCKECEIYSVEKEGDICSKCDG